MSMEMENISILRKKKALESALKNFVKRKDISKNNKKYVTDFINSMYLESYSAGRKLFYFCRFPKIIEYTNNKDLKSFTRKDIEKLIIRIETMDYAGWTKHAYKTTIKKFYKWIEGYPKGNVEFPSKVSWIKTYKRMDTKITASDILTADNVKSMISKAKKTRDKSIITILYEAGCRIGEFMNLRMKDLEFHDYGVHISIEGTKNIYSKRKLLLVTSLPILTQWVNEHPGKDNPNSFLWISFDHRYFGECMSYNAIRKIIKNCAERAGVKGKKLNLHCIRHSRATHLANKLTEAQMCKYFGWKVGSDIPSVYVHLCGRDIDNGILAMHGIVVDENKGVDFTYKVCPRCSKKSSPDTKVCECGLIMDERFALDYEKREKQMFAGLKEETIKEWISTAKEQIKRELLEEKGLLQKAEKYKFI